MPQSYQASYTVKGRSSGLLGSLDDNTTTQTRTLQAKNDHEAFFIASWYAHFLSMEHLTGSNGRTEVTLHILRRADNSEVDQRAETRHMGEKKKLDSQQLEQLLATFKEKMTITSDFWDHCLFYDKFRPIYRRLGFL